MIKGLGVGAGLLAVLGAVVSMGCMSGGTAVVSTQGTTYVVVKRAMRSDVYHCTAATGGRPVCTIATEQ